MKALTAPERWGLQRIVVLFGRVVRLDLQTCIAGDLLYDEQSDLIYTFLWREGEELGLSLYME
jgi:hypothetical protein